MSSATPPFSSPIHSLLASFNAAKKSRSLTTTQKQLAIAIVALSAAILNHLRQQALNRSSNANQKRVGSRPHISRNSSTQSGFSDDFLYGPRRTVLGMNETSPEVFEQNREMFPVAKLGQKVGVGKEFLRELRAIVNIIIPSVWSKEVFLLLLQSAFLVLRTWLSVVVAKLDGQIVRDLVSANGPAFLKGLGYWFAISLPATYTNSMIRYLQSKLAISFRTRLTRYVHDLYLNDRIPYYKVLNLDVRIEGADQYITTDIARFTETLSSLFSNLGKPLLDMFIFNYQLVQNIGFAGMIGLSVNYIVTARLLRAVSPAFGKLAAIEAKLEGDFRSAHARLITNAEEIAFYNGAPIEKTILNRSYRQLIRHVNSIYRLRIGYNMFEDFIIKYSWSAVGLLMSALPVFFPGWVSLTSQMGSSDKHKDDTGKHTSGFITNKRLMMSLADAGGRMMYSYKDLAELAGYTSRVYSLLAVLHELHAGNYMNVEQANGKEPVGEEEKQAKNKDKYLLTDIRGTVQEGYDGVKFLHVPIVVPAPDNPKGGEELIHDLNIEVGPGEHLLVTGPNGVGKSAVARVLSGLWPVWRGALAKPFGGEIFYVPQRPYLSLGTLRAQIIYPHSLEDMQDAGRTDEELLDILKAVHLEYIPEREGGFDTVKEWKDVFSGGEKQRVGIARLFYHRPRFAVLDECTSAVSSDVEGLMYNHAKEMGISLITISHRPALFKYHTHLLKLTGDHGRWEFSRIGTTEERMSSDKEIEALEAKLEQVEALKQRLREINAELQLSTAQKEGEGQDTSKGVLRHAKRTLVESD
ncbi:uncharacterized protein VTP21DRAFT_4928 [Calcarisporiella thermophila]|uniref:uncharacterized protein n=1 Tax=Calcarisporiella thermophila TaxID=911321 RepID=UPI003743BF38